MAKSKIGRWGKKCEKYRNENTRYRNKLRKFLKRIKTVKKETQEKIIKLNPIKENKK